MEGVVATASRTKQRLRVRVDPIKCTAFGFCAEFCPELFTLDDWGYAWLRSSVADAAMADLIYETARLCPREAILVETVDDRAEPYRSSRPSGSQRAHGHDSRTNRRAE
jgi:ferredoxin